MEDYGMDDDDEAQMSGHRQPAEEEDYGVDNDDEAQTSGHRQSAEGEEYGMDTEDEIENSRQRLFPPSQPRIYAKDSNGEGGDSEEEHEDRESDPCLLFVVAKFAVLQRSTSREMNSMIMMMTTTSFVSRISYSPCLTN